MKPLEEMVHEYIKKNATSNSPVDRYHMEKRFRVNERKIRDAIKALRKMENPICSSSSGRGYWEPETYEEYARFKAEHLHRALDEIDTVKKMDKGAERMFGRRVETDVDL